MNINFGQIVNEFYKKKKISVEELAKKFGKNKATVYCCENDELKELPYEAMLTTNEWKILSAWYKKEYEKAPYIVLGKKSEMNLQDFRKSKKLNQKEMAKEIGVSASYYYKVESGYQNPSFDFLVKLKKRFPDVNIDVMFLQKKKSH